MVWFESLRNLEKKEKKIDVLSLELWRFLEKKWRTKIWEEHKLVNSVTILKAFSRHFVNKFA